MEDSLTKGIMIVIALLMAISVALFAWSGYKTSSSAGDRTLAKTAATMTAIEESELRKYDNTTITGSQVKSILELKKDTWVMLVATTKRAASTNKFVNYGIEIDGSTAETTGTKNLGVNYTNKLLSSNQLTADVTTGSLKTKMANNSYIAEFKLKDGETIVNSNLSHINKKGTTDFINEAAKFKTYLIYDANDQLIGITMEQLP